MNMNTAKHRMPLVSIIVPMHNPAGTIVECLDSLLSQSYEKTEIILCDDRSTDNSSSLIKQYLSDPRISWISADGVGACAARNTAVRYSSGDYIQYLDADDLMAKNKLELQVHQLSACRNPDQTISFSSLVQFRDGSPPESGKRWHNDSIIFENPIQLLCKILYSDKYIQTGQWLISRKLAERTGPWNESLVADQDGEYFARALQRAHTVLSCPEAITYYRKAVADQISTRKNASHFQSRLRAFETKLQMIRETTEPKTLRAIVTKQCQWIATLSYPRSITCSRQAIRMLEQYKCGFHPSFPTTRLAMIAKIFGWRIARWCSFIKHAGKG